MKHHLYSYLDEMWYFINKLGRLMLLGSHQKGRVEDILVNYTSTKSFGGMIKHPNAHLMCCLSSSHIYPFIHLFIIMTEEIGVLIIHLQVFEQLLHCSFDKK